MQAMEPAAAAESAPQATGSALSVAHSEPAGQMVQVEEPVHDVRGISVNYVTPI